jgi:DNA-binding LacI/PurR family transcriptional regulator
VAGRTTRTITVTQVADQLRLSPTTVSLVLNGQARRYRISAATIERVKAAAEKLHYRPSVVARQLLGGRSNSVGVLIYTEAIADPRLIQKMEVRAASRGIRFIVGHAVGTPDRVKDYLDDFRARGVDGVISVFHNHPDYRNTVLAELAAFPRVVYYEKPSGPRALVSRACYVTPDYYTAGRLGVEHLLERGKQRIALVLNDLVFSYAQDRFRAYKDALKAAGRRFQSSLLWVMDQQPEMHWTEPFTAERAARVVHELVVEEAADGIVAVTDIFAARLIAALHRLGRRVPDDVAVIGCDNLDVGTIFEPQLTTIDLRLDDLTEGMMETLFALLDGKAIPATRRAVVVPPKLVVRQST